MSEWSREARPILRKTLDGWFDRVEYVSERVIVREPGWSGSRVLSEGGEDGEKG